jgi:MarR family transcriptional regulator, organic hydroperoxide resistance regulator
MTAVSSPNARKAAVAAEAWRAIFDFIVATAPQRNRYIGESGLTPNDARALTSLSSSDGRTMGSLAEEWKCDASTATWIVDRLEQRGLAERRPHPTDRRARLVLLTARGARLKASNMERMYVPPPALLELDLPDLVALRDAVARLAPIKPAGNPRRQRPRPRP